jgi:hypothetical protein
MWIALLFVLLAGNEMTFAQCDAAYVFGNIQGTWKVNNATGQGFGGMFYGKPQVSIGAVRGGITIDGKGPFLISQSFAPEANPQGGFWCSFVLNGEPARMMFASNNWWILEIGESRNRNKIELIRR